MKRWKVKWVMILNCRADEREVRGDRVGGPSGPRRGRRSIARAAEPVERGPQRRAADGSLRSPDRLCVRCALQLAAEGTLGAAQTLQARALQSRSRALALGMWPSHLRLVAIREIIDIHLRVLSKWGPTYNSLYTFSRLDFIWKFKGLSVCPTGSFNLKNLKKPFYPFCFFILFKNLKIIFNAFSLRTFGY